MTKYLYYFFRILISATLALFVVFLIFKTYQSWLDPIDVLRKKNIATEVAFKKLYEAKDLYNERMFIDVILGTKDEKGVHFTVSLPKKTSNGTLKCIFLAAGLENGQKSLNYIEDHSNYAIIAYEYPAVIKFYNSRFSLFRVNEVKNIIFSIPQQWLSIILWIQKQPWCRKEAISIAGFSFGSIFVPAAYHLAQVEKIQLGPGVIAYGGAGLKCLIKANLKFAKVPLSFLGSILFRPIDPLVHAKYLRNSFLLINGLSDQMVPSSCRKKLQSIIPEPKKIINLQTEHMSPKDQPLLNKLVDISKDFLEN